MAVDTKALLRALREPFPVEDLEWRLGAKNEGQGRGLALPFITARAVMERLDDVLGPENWQDDYEKVNETKGWICRLKVRLDGEWIIKTDGADERPSMGDMRIETKSGISDSLKRAAVKLGIGRPLYYLEPIWAPIKQRGRSWVIDMENWTPRLPAWCLPGGSGFPSQKPSGDPETEVVSEGPEPERARTVRDGVDSAVGDPPSNGGWSGTEYWNPEGPNAHIRPAPLPEHGAKPAFFREAHGLPGKNPLSSKWNIPLKDMTFEELSRGSLGGERYRRMVWEIDTIENKNPKFRDKHRDFIAKLKATIIWMEEHGPNKTPF